MADPTEVKSEKQPVPTEVSAAAKKTELMKRISKAVEDTEDEDSLLKEGTLLYETFKSKEYSPDMVLSSIRESYKEHKDEFDPPKSFHDFIRSFGKSLVMLCQQKLLEDNEDCDLGKSGEKQDGIDGIIGKLTGPALDAYFEEMDKANKGPKEASNATEVATKSEAASSATEVAGYQAASAPAKTQPESAAQPERQPDSAALFKPYQRGTEKGRFTDMGSLQKNIRSEIYDPNKSTYNVDTLHDYFGKEGHEIQQYLTIVDPVTKGPITFMGKKIDKLNLEMLVFLKITEQNIKAKNLKYLPGGISGYQDRNLHFINQENDPKLMELALRTPSFHKYGMAIDIDYSKNRPENGRGDIPDEIITTMCETGLAWGGVGDSHERSSSYLGRDPMHFQPRFPADSEEGQAIIQASPIGQEYWRVIGPMLREIKQKKQPTGETNAIR